MSARRRASRSRFPAGLFFLGILVIVEGVWLAAFIWATGSFLPPGLTRAKPVENILQGSRQERLDDQKLREMLVRKASRGAAEVPPPPQQPRAPK